MLYEGLEFTPRLGARRSTARTFSASARSTTSMSTAVSFSGLMEGCTFTRAQLYWGFFNVASLIDVRFVDCVFPGASFRGCRLVQCTFENCRFILDNLGGSATIDDCSFTNAGSTAARSSAHRAIE